MTVVWLRLPKARPIAGRRRVGQLAREVHGDLAGERDRLGAARARAARPSRRRTPRRSAPGSPCTERTRRLELWIEAGEDLAGELGGDRRGRSATRTRRRGSARPRARGCWSSTRSAISSSAAGSTSPTSSWATRLRRIVSRVARSGGLTSHTRPASKRSRSRSSSASMSRGEAVGGQHELGAGLVERVEGVEELLLGLGLALQELDVVDEQHVDAAVGGLERLEAAALERADEVVGERLDGRVADGQPGAVLGDVVGDRVQQVGLAEAGRAADEERVVGQAGHLGHGERGRVGEPVAVADHELVERQARVELLRDRGALGLGARRGRPRPAARARRSPRARRGRARSRRRRSAGGRSGSRPTSATSSGASSTSVVPASSRKLERARARCATWSR